MGLVPGTHGQKPIRKYAHGRIFGKSATKYAQGVFYKSLVPNTLPEATYLVLDIFSVTMVYRHTALLFPCSIWKLVFENAGVPGGGWKLTKQWQLTVN